MTINRAVLAVTCALLSSGCALEWSGLANRCDETAARNATLEVGDATRLRVTARAGSLQIEGRPNLSEVRIAGTACAPSQAALERIELVTSRSGDDLLVEARTEDTNGRLALVIELPDSLPVEVDDTSGSVRIIGVAAVTIADGSGSIRVDQVAGDVRVTDGSGGIDIHGVEGSVIIEDDGSGNIDISDVRQDVVIEEDGSGNVRASDVGGDFIVRRDGSGAIRYDRVGGRVSTPDN